MEWDNGPRRQLGPGRSIRRPLGKYKELPEKFRLEMLALSLLNLYGGKCPNRENVDQDACMKAVQFAHIHIPLSSMIYRRKSTGTLI